MKTDILYVIESGSYSDYSVHCAFEDKATAELWAKTLNESEGSYGDYSVSSMPIVATGEKPKKVTTYQIQINLWDDMTTTDEREASNTDWAIVGYNATPPKRPHVRFVRAPWHNNKGGRLEIRGASQTSVRKVFSERMAAWKAGSWITKDLREWTNDKPRAK